MEPVAPAAAVSRLGGRLMCVATIYHDRSDTILARRLRDELSLRQAHAVTSEYGTKATRPDAWLAAGQPAVVALIPASATSERMQVIAALLRRIIKAGGHVVVVAGNIELPVEVVEIATDIIRFGIQPADDVIEQVFISVYGPRPSYLDVRVRPAVMGFVGGVAWWTDDIYLIDTDTESVAKVERSRTGIVWTGLEEAQQIGVDRSTAFVANKGAHQIQVHQIRDGGFVTPKFIRSIDGHKLCRPTGVGLGHGELGVADTDNHRAAFTAVSSLTRVRGNELRARWTLCRPKIPFNFPCGIAVDDKTVWVADTFANRVVVFDHLGTERYKFPVAECPVGIAVWHDLVFIATDGGVQVARRERNGFKAELITTLADGHVGNSFGLSVNVDNRLAISDRSKHCVWIVDLELWMSQQRLPA